mmetsp:Transcript_5708/g.10210  ORF Transcript_5708/g.10210 Transcript_5708/m.10210 type:complete len:181 (-) Transcript_5708:3066-3608(-)
MMFAITLLALHSVHSFDIITVPPAGNPPQRRQLGVMCMDPTAKLLLTFGGFKDASYSFDDLWIYDITARKWTIVVSPSYTAPCNGYTAESIRGSCFVDSVSRKFFIFGGSTSIGFSNDMWAFDIENYTVDSKQWTQVTQKGSIPPGMSGFSYATFLLGGKLTFAVTKGLALRNQTNDVFL